MPTHPVLTVGSVAFDSITTPFGEASRVVGGAATYFSVGRELQITMKGQAGINHRLLAGCRVSPGKYAGLPEKQRLESKCFAQCLDRSHIHQVDLYQLPGQVTGHRDCRPG